MLMLYLSMLETDEDKQNFEQLYIRYAQDMYAVAYNILKNKEDAEDAVHQSFLKIAENFRKISQIPCHEIKPYIVIISRNTAINIYNKNKKRAEHSAVLPDETVDYVSSYPQDEYYELVSAIKQLPQMYKDILFLYCLQEFSAKETAKMLDITVDTVRQRALRAKRMLKEILEKGESDD